MAYNWSNMYLICQRKLQRYIAQDKLRRVTILRLFLNKLKLHSDYSYSIPPLDPGGISDYEEPKNYLEAIFSEQGLKDMEDLFGFSPTSDATQPQPQPSNEPKVEKPINNVPVNYDPEMEVLDQLLSILDPPKKNLKRKRCDEDC